MESIIFPLYLSLKIAAFATFFSFIIGILFSWVFVFYKNKWTTLLSLLTNVPLVLPPTVLGYYLLLVIGRNSTLGKWYETIVGQPFVFTWKAAVLAAMLASLPLLIRPIQASFESIDTNILQAAAIDGASKKEMLFKIIIPLSYKGILAGIILGFARSMGEFGATLMVAGSIPGKTQTLSIAIYDAVQAGQMAQAHMMVIILTVVTILMLMFINRYLKQKGI